MDNLEVSFVLKSREETKPTAISRQVSVCLCAGNITDLVSWTEDLSPVSLENKKRSHSGSCASCNCDPVWCPYSSRNEAISFPVNKCLRKETERPQFATNVSHQSITSNTIWFLTCQPSTTNCWRAGVVGSALWSVWFGIDVSLVWTKQMFTI